LEVRFFSGLPFHVFDAQSTGSTEILSAYIFIAMAITVMVVAIVPK
jgi:hypothetical protein